MQNEERINGLETQVRTLKRIVYGFGCLLVAGIVVGATSLQTVPDVIQAKKFEIVNGEGKKVVVLANNPQQGGMFFLANKDGKLVASISAPASGGSLTIHNKHGKALVGIGVDADGGILEVRNKDGQGVALIGADKNGDGSFGTLNSKGNKTGLFP